MSRRRIRDSPVDDNSGYDDGSVLQASLDKMLPAGMEVNYQTMPDSNSVSGANRSIQSGEYSVVEHSFNKEMYILLSIALPIMLYLGSQMVQLLTDLTILGHYGEDEFAAIAMGDTWIQIMQVFLRASWLPLQTLVGQAYGAQNYRMCAIWFQIVTIIELLMTIPCFFGYYYSKPILDDLDQTDSVLDMAQEFTRYMCISIIPTALFGMERNFFAGQNIVKPSAYVNTFAVIFNGILGYFFVYELYGFKGSPLAISTSRWATLIVYHIYCFNYMKFHRFKGTWVPWSCDNFTKDRLCKAMVFVIPNLIAVMLETWAFQVISLFAGSLGSKEISVMVYTANLTLLLNAFAQGLGLATNLRISHLLGAGEPSAAKHTARVTLVITATFGLIGGCLIYFGESGIAWMMSNDKDVQDLFKDISFWVAFSFFMSSCITPMAKICMGQGRPGTMALVMMLTTWAINIPCAYTLGIKEGHGIEGLWMGMSIGYAIAALCLSLIVWRSDWVGYSFDAQERNRSTSRESSVGLQISRSVSQPQDADL